MWVRAEVWHLAANCYTPRLTLLTDLQPTQPKLTPAINKSSVSETHNMTLWWWLRKLADQETETHSNDFMTNTETVHWPQLVFLMLLHLISNYSRRLWCHNDAIHDKLACLCQRFTRWLALTTNKRHREADKHSLSALSSISSSLYDSNMQRLQPANDVAVN